MTHRSSAVRRAGNRSSTAAAPAVGLLEQTEVLGAGIAGKLPGHLQGAPFDVRILRHSAHKQGKTIRSSGRRRWLSDRTRPVERPRKWDGAHRSVTGIRQPGKRKPAILQVGGRSPGRSLPVPCSLAGAFPAQSRGCGLDIFDGCTIIDSWRGRGTLAWFAVGNPAPGREPPAANSSSGGTGRTVEE